ncbi:MAG: FAD-dependent oxidoreductase [Burkholderiaceae bacterium]
MVSDEAQVVVLGAGLVGICTALALCEHGHPVTLIDRDEPGQGASMGNAGVIASMSCVPQSVPGLLRKVPGWLLDPEGPVALRLAYAPRMLPWLGRFLAAGSERRLPPIADAMLALNRPNLELYKALVADTPAAGLVRDAYYVFVSRDEADLNTQALMWRLRAERGVPFERIDGAALRELEPDISPDYQGAVIIGAHGRVTDPGRLGQVLAQKASMQGVRVLRGQVSALRAEGDAGWRLDMDTGPMRARSVVLTAGVWSARLLESLRVRTPLEAERGYHLMFADPGVSLRHSVHDISGKVVLSSMDMGVRCAGTAEFAGIDAAPDYRRARIFKTLARRLLPSLNTAQTVEWMGRRPATPDSLPYIGPVPGYHQLYAGFGHGHLGLTGAPHTARLLAALVDGRDPGIDLTPFRLDRFS